MARKQASLNNLGDMSSPAAASARRSSRRSKQPAAETPAPTPVQTGLKKAASEPTWEQIALLAYSYWEARGRQGGSPEEDWIRAERELRLSSASVS